jgi:hypothetical protein
MQDVPLETLVALRLWLLHGLFALPGLSQFFFHLVLSFRACA